MAASLRAPACGTHIAMPRQQLAVRAATGTPVAHPHPRLRRRTGAAAVAPPVTAAQKKVFTSFTDMIGQSSEPVLVEFYATWCGPCQMMGNILGEVAPALRGRVKVVKVDTEKYPTVANQYQIGALPTLILFKNGKPVDRMEGVVGAADLRNRLEYFAAGQPGQQAQQQQASQQQQ